MGVDHDGSRAEPPSHVAVRALETNVHGTRVLNTGANLAGRAPESNEAPRDGGRNLALGCGGSGFLCSRTKAPHGYNRPHLIASVTVARIASPDRSLATTLPSGPISQTEGTV